MDLKWAKKDTIDDPAASGSIAKHDAQGTWPGINLLPEDMKPSTPMMKFENSQMRSVDGGNLKYYWMTKDGMIWFKVIAKAKGWVALGVTKERSTDMKGFDVAVGGVGGGGSYLGVRKSDVTRMTSFIIAPETAPQSTISLRLLIFLCLLFISLIT